ncbi:discoidin domain-containing protein [Paenibacillus tarimensis]
MLNKTSKVMCILLMLSSLILFSTGSAIIANDGGEPPPQQLTVAEVKASSWTASNRMPENTIDGIVGGESRWVAQNIGDWIRFDLGAARKISSVDIAWVEGRQWYYDIEVSKDGSNWVPVIQYDPEGTEGKSGGTGGIFEPNAIGGELARYVKITNHGNSLTNPLQNTYIGIYEVVIMGTELGESSDDASLTGIRIDGSDLQMFEADLLRYDLILNDSSSVPVVEAVYGNPNAIVNITQADKLPGVAVIDVTSEDYSNHNQYKVNFISPAYTIQSVHASRSDPGFGPELTLDLDYGSNWKVEGKGHYLQYELNTVQNINSVAIAWSSGNERIFYFDVLTSLDGDNWHQAYRGESSGTTLDLETYSFPNIEAKYVRIVGNGNNVTAYNSIFEIVIYAQSDRGEIPIRTLYQGPVKLQLMSDKTGYIFTHPEQPVFDLKTMNIGDAAEEFTIVYSVFSSNGRKVISETIPLNMNRWSSLAQQLLLPLDMKGVFTLKLNLYNSGGLLLEKSIPFSRITENAEGPGRDFFGVNTHLHTGTGDIDKTLEVAAMSGTGWIRDSGYWSRAETVKGVVEIQPVWDEYVNKAVEKGLKPLYLLAYGNIHYGRHAPTTPENIAGYVNYASTIAAHFAGRINHFEVWNEFNGGLGNPDLHPPEVYAELLKATYPAVKAANPDAFVIGGVTAGVPLEWLERILQAGAFDYMDAVSIHPYMHPASPESRNFLATLEDVRDLFEKYGGPKPIWITEIGWPTHTTGSGVSPLESANYAVRTHVIGLASGIPDHIFWYDMQNDGNSPTDPEHNFGLVTADRSQIPFAAKENYAAYSAMTDKLAGAAFVRSYEPNPNTRIYHFHRASDNKAVIAAWTLQGMETFGFEADSGSLIEMSDIFGNNLLSGSGIITATLTETPVYIEGNFTNLNLAEAGYELDKMFVNALADETFDISMLSSNGFNGGMDVITTDFPDGWILAQKGDVIDGRVPMKVKTSSNADNTAHELYFYVTSNGYTHTRLAVNVYLSDRLFSTELSTRPADRFGYEWEMELELTNYSSMRTINAMYEMMEPAEWSNAVGQIEASIGPGAVETVSITVPEKIADSERKADYKVTADEESESVSKTLDFLHAFNESKAISVDGTDTNNEWSGAVPFVLDTEEKVVRIEDWGGTSDLSGRGSLKWDNSHFYMIVEVEDNIHDQTGTDGGIWSGDSIQFAVDPGLLEGGQNSGYSEIGMALSEGGIEVWRWSAPLGMAAGEMNHTQAIVSRTGTKTTYEISIPWSELLPGQLSVKPGDSIGFSLLINDNDGSGRRGWMEYGGGIGSSKNPSLFKELHMLERVSVEALLRLLSSYAASGELSKSMYNDLSNLLKSAQNQYNKGSVPKAIETVEKFLSVLKNENRISEVSANAKEVLNSGASALIRHWSECNN